MVEDGLWVSLPRYKFCSHHLLYSLSKLLNDSDLSLFISRIVEPLSQGCD